MDTDIFGSVINIGSPGPLVYLTYELFKVPNMCITQGAAVIALNQHRTFETRVGLTISSSIDQLDPLSTNEYHIRTIINRGYYFFSFFCDVGFSLMFGSIPLKLRGY